jgi:putative membrane protein
MSFPDITRGWSFPPQVVVPLALSAELYLLAVQRIRGRARPRWRASRTSCFLGGLAVLAISLESPIDAYAHRLLSVHMIQHMLIMQVGAPLLLLGRPITLTLAASPRWVRTRLAGLAHSRAARVVGSPVVGFGSFAVVLWAAHLSPLYEATLTNPPLHELEHAVFLIAALLFWWPLVARDPGAVRLSHPARLLYVFLSMPVMSLLGFVLSSSNHVLYLHYAFVSGSGALGDQRLAGTLMWEGSMLVSAVALSAILLDWMHREERETVRQDLVRDRSRVREAPAEIAGGTSETGVYDLRSVAGPSIVRRTEEVSLARPVPPPGDGSELR